MNSDSHSNTGQVLAGFVIGAAVGAGIALLMAPRTGVETRRQIGDTARRLTANTKNRLDSMRQSLRDGARGVGAAVEAGREAYRNAQSDTPSSAQSASAQENA